MVGMWSVFNELGPLATKARVIRCYDTTSTFECIFHDKEGTRFHFTANKNIASKFKTKFQEGEHYAIRNFGVTHNTSKFRVTSHEYKATFYQNTEVRVETNKSFPNLIYAFKSFGDILAIKKIVEAVPIDVIGRVAFKGNPTTVKTKEGIQKKVMDLILEDIEGNRINCTLWEDYVDLCMKQFEEQEEDVNIIILQFCRPIMYQGTIKLQNGYHVTKIVLNPDIPEVHHFKKRLFDSGLHTEYITSTPHGTNSTIINDLASGADVITIKELCENTEGGSFWICGTVVNIDEGHGWFYISCKKCSKKLEKKDHRFKCKKCETYPESGDMKYKIVINVADESSSSPFILWDEESRNVIGKSAAEVGCEITEVIPKEIEDALLDRKFMFKIKVPFGEGWGYNKAYTISTVSANPNIIAADSTSCADNQQSNSFSILESSNEVVSTIRDEKPIGAQSKLEDGCDEWIDDGSTRRRLSDQFSALKPPKKAKITVKQEKP